MSSGNMPFIAIAIALGLVFLGTFIAIAAARSRGPRVTHIETRTHDTDGDR